MPVIVTQEGTIAPALNINLGTTAAAKADKPDTKRLALTRMEDLWTLPDLLMGGTQAMRDAGTAVLPQESDETPEEYELRKKRPFLTNYYGNTIGTHSGMPFGAEITIEPPLPERLAYLEENADGCGRSLTVFSRELMQDAMHRGLSHVLVDVPKNEGDSSYADTLTRQPRFVHVKAPSLLGVRGAVGRDGGEDVRYVRFRSTETLQDGRYSEATNETIIEIAVDAAATGATTTTYRLVDGEWDLGTTTPYLLPGEKAPSSIPLVTLYAKQTGPWEGAPAYLPLAEINLAHYQSDADQRHALSYGRRATLVKTGWRDDGGGPAEAAAARAAGRATSGGGKTTLGYRRQIRNVNDAAKVYFLETSGAPLAAGRDDLADLEQRMERFGAQQVSKGGGITAMSRQLDNQRDTCNLQAWCTRTELVILHALRAAAAWVDVELPADQRVSIDRSFAEDRSRADTDVPNVLQAGRDGYITRATVVRELAARNVLTTVTDPDAEAAAAGEQGQNDVMSTMMRQAESMIAARGGGIGGNPGAGASGGDPVSGAA